MKRARKYIADSLVSIARKIDPGNQATMQFLMDRVIDFVISGKSTIKVTVVDPFSKGADK